MSLKAILVLMGTVMRCGGTNKSEQHSYLGCYLARFKIISMMIGFGRILV